MRDFVKKYGITAMEMTSRNAADVAAMAKRQAEHDASLVRAGRVDPNGMDVIIRKAA